MELHWGIDSNKRKKEERKTNAENLTWHKGKQTKEKGNSVGNIPIF